MEFAFQWMTMEYPEWVGGPYGDALEIWLSIPEPFGPEPEPIQLALDLDGSGINTNDAEMRVLGPELEGTEFVKSGATGWLHVQTPVPPGGYIELHFTTYDVADGLFNSVVLLDGFAFSDQVLDEIAVGLLWP